MLLNSLGTSTGEAQSASDVLRELSYTDEILVKARRLVIDDQCPSQRARDLIVQAADMQKEAWSAYGRGLHRAAMKGTKLARGLAQEAIKIAERWKFVKNHIDRTAELLELASQLVAESHDDQAAALLETALGQFERGKEALRAGQVEQAFYLLRNANKLARDVVARLQEGDLDHQRVIRELERTDRLIEKARPLVQESGDEAAASLFDQGLQMQMKAWEFFRRGRQKVAQELTLKARQLVARALALVEGPLSAEIVRGAVQTTDDLMARVRVTIMESQNQEAIDLFEAAEDHQDEAKAALSEGHLKLALAQTKIARRLVDKALDLIGGA
jgi:hypothetical protein